MPCCINSLVKNCCFVCDPFEIQNDFFRDMKSERRHILMIFHATAEQQLLAEWTRNFIAFRFYICSFVEIGTGQNCNNSLN